MSGFYTNQNGPIHNETGVYVGPITARVQLTDAAGLPVSGGGPQGLSHKVKKITITGVSAASEIDSTFDLPAKAVVRDVYVDVTTAEVTGTTKALDIGLLSSESGGDADGFVHQISVASTGIKRAGAALDGTNNWFVAGLRGALLARTVAGTNADDRGLYIEFPHLSTSVTARSVTYTPASAFTEFRGSIYIVYDEIG